MKLALLFTLFAVVLAVASAATKAQIQTQADALNQDAQELQDHYDKEVETSLERLKKKAKADAKSAKTGAKKTELNLKYQIESKEILTNMKAIFNAQLGYIGDELRDLTKTAADSGLSSEVEQILKSVEKTTKEVEDNVDKIFETADDDTAAFLNKIFK